MKRYELTKGQWERIKELLPPERAGKRGRPRKDDRNMLNGMLWIVCSGAQWRELPKKVEISGSNVLADRAYISEQGARYVIPPQMNVSDSWPVDGCLYKGWHLVECFFQKLKWFRRIATRYDKLDASFLAFVYIAAIAVLLI